MLAASSLRLLSRNPGSMATALRRSMSSQKSVSGTVGLIGLGNMGGPMAINAVKGCEKVIVLDVDASSVQRVVSEGGVAAKSLSDFKEAHTIITSLPANDHVKLVYGGEEGLLNVMPKGVQYIDTSTISPIVAREVAAQAEARGSTFVDAPVSGGVPGAVAGTLTFMLGTDAAGVDRLRPVLQTMGKNLVACGGAGNGQVAKLCNNLVLAVSMMGVAEGMRLGGSLGIDQKVLASIFNSSTARCWSSDTYNPCPGVMENVPAARGFDGGFGVDLMLKDLGLAIEAGHAARQATPAGGLAMQLYSVLSSQGFGKKDFGVIYELLGKKKL